MRISLPLRILLGVSSMLLIACSSGGRNDGDGGGFPDPGDGPITTGADGGDAGGPIDKCPGFAIAADGVLDLTVKAVKVSGQVTLNGAALPTSNGSRGTLSFADKRTGLVTAKALPTTGPGTYEVILRPGMYDVTYQGPSTGCGGATAPMLPCNGGTVVQSANLMASGVLDVDVKMVRVSGKVTLKGGAFPTGPNPGTLAFGPVSGAASTAQAVSTAGFSIPTNGAYQLAVLAGQYDVTYGGSSSCTQAGAPPCNGGALKSGVSLSADGVLDLDVPAIRVTGNVTVKGAQPAGGFAGGAVAFAAASGGPQVSATTVSIPTGGAYAASLFPATYVVSFSGASNGCGQASPAVPCTGGVLKPQVALTADGVLDLDVPMVVISGKITLNGAAPAPSANLGAISFYTDATSSSMKSTSLLLNLSSATYTAALFPQTYTVGYSGAGNDCAGPMPCNSGPLKPSTAITSDGVLDLDVPAVAVSGKVTVNGAPLPATSQWGSVAFSSKTMGSASFQLDTAMGPAYAVTILPGTYDVSYSGDSAECTGTAPPAVPCNSGVIKPAVALSAAGVLDLDVPMVKVSGKVLLDGAPLPLGATSAADIVFAAKAGGSATSASFSKVGGPTYSLALVKGTYVATFNADSNSCGGTTLVPCDDQVVLGCE
jgi:hypothetical protein